MKHYPFIAFYLFCNLFIYVFKGSPWVYVACFLAFIAVVIWGSLNIQLSYFVQNITHKKTRKKEIALTFDDGPTKHTPKFLDLLKEHEVKATFFCIGKQIKKHPETFQRIIAEGHTIGNHTYSHSTSIGFASTQKVIDEIRKTDDIILQTGNITTDLYRPPFGVTNPNIARAIRKTKKKSIGWNIRSLDTIIDDEKKIYKRVTNGVKPGGIILFHDISEKTYHVLGDLLLFLKQENYSTFTVDHIIKSKQDD
ncbi:polysaccharide deacetylase family protein [Chryseobacterium sp.]|uniref:polysaccharide deacetylase family protein n=1 Tax=Chryseobacterium sp. TaxID=1871047 RepID=UPI0025BAC98F|nr:polysaccharide deacetylase family protein [Chryseobacterium sp.]